MWAGLLQKKLKAWQEQMLNCPTSKREFWRRLELELQVVAPSGSPCRWELASFLNPVRLIPSDTFLSIYTHTSFWFCFSGESWLVHRSGEQAPGLLLCMLISASRLTRAWISSSTKWRFLYYLEGGWRERIRSTGCIMAAKQRVVLKREHYKPETKETISPPLKELIPLQEREVTMEVLCTSTKP